MVHDKKSFQIAQPAGLCDRVEGGGPAQDVPADGVWDVRVLQSPHVAGQCSISPTLRVGEIMFVTSPPDFELIPCESSVGLSVSVVLACDGCLVHHTLLSQATVLGQGTLGLVSTVATFTDNIISIAGFEDSAIVLGNFSFHVGQTRIGKLDCVRITNFMELVVGGK